MFENKRADYEHKTCIVYAAVFNNNNNNNKTLLLAPSQNKTDEEQDHLQQYNYTKKLLDHVEKKYNRETKILKTKIQTKWSEE